MSGHSHVTENARWLHCHFGAGAGGGGGGGASDEKKKKERNTAFCNFKPPTGVFKYLTSSPSLRGASKGQAMAGTATSEQLLFPFTKE